MPRTETEVLTAHVPRPLVETVDQMAARLERSRGWIAQEEERTRLTREALADRLDTESPLPVPH